MAGSTSTSPTSSFSLPLISGDLGIFWDIENCQIPRDGQPFPICQKIRNLGFCSGFKEQQFAVACDAKKEDRFILDELNRAQVDIFHVNSTKKNAADAKLKKLMKRFVETYPSNSRIVLISGDGDFTTDIFDMNRQNVETLLIHPNQPAKELKVFAHKTISFAELTSTQALPGGGNHLNRRPQRGQSLGRLSQPAKPRPRTFSSTENLAQAPPQPTSCPLLNPAVLRPDRGRKPHNNSIITPESLAQTSCFQPIIPVNTNAEEPVRNCADLDSRGVRFDYPAGISPMSVVSSNEESKASSGQISPVTSEPSAASSTEDTKAAQLEVASPKSTTNSRFSRNHDMKNRNPSQRIENFLNTDDIIYQIHLPMSANEEEGERFEARVYQLVYRCVGDFVVDKTVIPTGAKILSLSLKSIDQAVLVRDRLEAEFADMLRPKTGRRTMKCECLRRDDEQIVRIISIINKIVAQRPKCPEGVDMSFSLENIYLKLYDEDIHPGEIKDLVLKYRRISQVDPGDFSGLARAIPARDRAVSILEKQPFVLLQELQDMELGNDQLESVVRGQDPLLYLTNTRHHGDIVCLKNGAIVHRFVYEAQRVCCRIYLEKNFEKISLDVFTDAWREMFPDDSEVMCLSALSNSFLDFKVDLGYISLTPIFKLCCYVWQSWKASSHLKLPIPVDIIDAYIERVTSFINDNIMCKDVADIFEKMNNFFFLYNNRSMVGLLEEDAGLEADLFRLKQTGGSLGWTTEDWEHVEELLDLAGLSLPDQHYSTPVKNSTNRKPGAERRHRHISNSRKKNNRKAKTSPNGKYDAKSLTSPKRRPTAEAPTASKSQPTEELAAVAAQAAAPGSNPGDEGSGGGIDLNASIESSSGLQRILESVGTSGARSLRQEQIFSQAQQTATGLSVTKLKVEDSKIEQTSADHIPKIGKLKLCATKKLVDSELSDLEEEFELPDLEERPTDTAGVIVIPDNDREENVTSDKLDTSDAVFDDEEIITIGEMSDSEDEIKPVVKQKVEKQIGYATAALESSKLGNEENQKQSNFKNGQTQPKSSLISPQHLHQEWCNINHRPASNGQQRFQQRSHGFINGYHNVGIGNGLLDFPYRPPGGIWNLNAFHQQGHNSNFFHHAQPPSAAPWRPPFRPDYFQRFGRHPQPFFIPPPPRPLRRRSGGSGGSDGSCVGVVKTTPRNISSAESSAQAKPASPSSLTKDQTKTSATATGNPHYRLSSSGNGVLNAAPTTSDCRKSATPPSPSRVNKRAKNGKRKNIAANFDNL